MFKYIIEAWITVNDSCNCEEDTWYVFADNVVEAYQKLLITAGDGANVTINFIHKDMR